MKFELKKEHIKLTTRLDFLADAFFVPEEGMKYIPCINPKRPFGNSSILRDIIEITTGTVPDELTEDQEQQAKRFLIELPVALEVIMETQTFTPGVYDVDDYRAAFTYRANRNVLFWEKALAGIKHNAIAKMVLDVCRENTTGDPYKTLREIDKWPEEYSNGASIRHAKDMLKDHAVTKWCQEHTECQYCKLSGGLCDKSSCSFSEELCDKEKLLEHLLAP